MPKEAVSKMYQSYSLDVLLNFLFSHVPTLETHLEVQEGIEVGIHTRASLLVNFWHFSLAHSLPVDFKVEKK